MNALKYDYWYFNAFVYVMSVSLGKGILAPPPLPIEYYFGEDVIPSASVDSHSFLGHYWRWITMGERRKVLLCVGGTS